MAAARKAARKAKEKAERVLAERQWPIQITLKHPIDFGSDRISTLEFRRGRLGDLRGIRIDGIPTADQLIVIASRMCNRTTEELARLEDEDGSEVVEIALGFFARCLGGGKTP